MPRAFPFLVYHVLVMILIAGMVICQSCGAVKSGPGRDVVDCTVGDLAQLEALVPLIADSPDLETQLEKAGMQVGGCIWAHLVDRYLGTTIVIGPDGPKKALPPGVVDPKDPRPRLDRFRAHVAPGVGFKTKAAVR